LNSVVLRVLVFVVLLVSGASAWGDETADRKEIARHVRALMADRDFDALEALAETYRSSDQRLGSGVWKLEIFYNAIDEDFDGRGQEAAFWTQKGELVDAWRQAHPQSPTAHVAVANLLLRLGWSFRGGGFAHTVPEANWAPFRHYTAEAQRYLEAHKEVADRDPHWYAMMEQIALRQGWERERFQLLFEEATARHPGYYAIYFRAVTYLTPRWGGDADAVDAFARLAMKMTSATEGAGLYARVYWVAISTEFGRGFPGNSNVDWELMVQGMEDVLARYPSDWNVQNFAYFSCLADDRPRMLSLMARMQEAPDMEVWRSQARYEDCKAWAGRARLG